MQFLKFMQTALPVLVVAQYGPLLAAAQKEEAEKEEAEKEECMEEEEGSPVWDK